MSYFEEAPNNQTPSNCFLSENDIIKLNQVNMSDPLIKCNYKFQKFCQLIVLAPDRFAYSLLSVYYTGPAL